MKSKLYKILSLTNALLISLIFTSFLNAQELTEILDENDTTYFLIRDKVATYLDTVQSNGQGINGGSDSIIEDGFVANFHRFNQYYANRVDENGSIKTASAKMIEALDYQIDFGCDSYGEAEWQNVGQIIDNTVQERGPNYGRIDGISIRPSNSDIIVVGGANGGIWRTEDGGANWENVTDQNGLSVAGVREFVRHPDDEDIIIAITKNHFTTFGKFEREEIGIGILVSFDDGQTWEQTSYTNGYNKHTELYSIAIDPNSTILNTTIYVGTPRTIDKYSGSINGITTQPWERDWHVEPTYISGFRPRNGFVNFHDMIVDDSGIFWYCNALGVYKYYNGFHTKINNFPIEAGDYSPDLSNLPKPCNPAGVFNNPGYYNAKLAKNMLGQIFAYVVLYPIDQNCKSTSKELSYFFRTSDGGVSWSGSKFTEEHRLGNLENYFAVSHYDSLTIYLESYRGPNKDDFRRVIKTTDFGQTFDYNENASYYHEDIRNITYFGRTSDGTNDIVYIGTDGGIMKTEDGTNWQDITGNGILCGNYYGVGISEHLDGIKYVGGQDGSYRVYDRDIVYTTRINGDNGDVGIAYVEMDPVVYQQTQSAIGKRINQSGPGQIAQNSPPGGFPIVFNLSVNNRFSYPPIFINPQNQRQKFVPIFGGVQLIEISETTGSEVKHDLIQDLSVHANGRASCVAMSESNQDVIFYGVNHYNGDLIGELMKATRINGDNDNWSVVKISGATSFPLLPVSGVAVSPTNIDHIWVTFSGYASDPNETKRRVFKTTNGGISWTNISGCLPDVAVNKIMYHNTGKDGLVIGTDYGVYYTDNDMMEGTDQMWSMYGEGTPRCMISDVEIRNCDNKVVVSTHGRGIWEADLPERILITDISGNETWDEDRLIDNTVRILSGATLNITNAEIRIAKDANIIVSPGAQLTLNGAMLTNQCSSLWGGIVVRGVANQSQSSGMQGVLQSTNSTIENARIGIYAGDDDLNFTGGIVNCTNTTFRNNKRSVAYMKYRNFNPSNPAITWENQGTFTDCDFLQDDVLPNGEKFSAFVTMWAVDNVKFYGNSFFNDVASIDQLNDLGYGIKAKDASFKLNGCTGTCPLEDPCCDLNPNVFTNLKYGVWFSQAFGNRAPYIAGNRFENCYKGVQIAGGVNAFIVNNEFEIGYLPPGITATKRAYGIFLDQTNAFIVEQNTVTASIDQNQQQTYGILVRNSLVEKSKVNDRIYNNTLVGLTHGNLADGNNAEQYDDATNRFPQGLRYLCNDHQSSGNFDIHIENGYGIQREQLAINALGQLLPAGNTFTPSISDFNIFNTAVNNVDYYHGLASNEIPSSVSSSSVTNIPNNDQSSECFDYFEFEEENPGGPEKNLTEIKNELDDFILTRDSTKTVIQTELVKNTTLNLASRVANPSAYNKTLEQDLLSVSPFLTQEVAELLIVNSQFPSSDLIDILSANPELLRIDTVIQLIISAVTPSISEQAQLTQAKQSISLRGELESVVLAADAIADDIRHKYLRSLSETQQDQSTINYNPTIDSVLQSYTSLDLSYYVLEQSFESPLQTSIPIEFVNIENSLEAGSAVLIEYEHLEDLYDLTIDIHQDNREIHQMDSLEVIDLVSLTIVDDLSSQKAKGILEFFYNYSFDNPTTMQSLSVSPDNTSEQVDNERTSLIEKRLRTSAITISPNPASQQIRIQYENVSKYGNHGKIIILDTYGQIKRQFDISTDNQSFSVDISTWPSGVYYCRHYSSKEQFQTKAFIKQ